MSYPAAKAEPRVGVDACGDSFLMSNGGWEVDVSLGTDGDVGAAVVELILDVGVLGFERLAKGEFGSEGGPWLEVTFGGGGVDERVISRSNVLAGIYVYWMVSVMRSYTRPRGRGQQYFFFATRQKASRLRARALIRAAIRFLTTALRTEATGGWWKMLRKEVSKISRLNLLIP